MSVFSTIYGTGITYNYIDRGFCAYAVWNSGAVCGTYMHSCRSGGRLQGPAGGPSLGSVRAEQACDGTTTTRRTQCGLGCAAGCGGWAGSNTCFEHRFAALSALLPHGRFARCAPHAAIAAALAKQYLPCRPHGINATRPVEMAVGRLGRCVATPLHAWRRRARGA